MLISAKGPPGSLLGIKGITTVSSAPGKTIAYIKDNSAIVIASYTYDDRIGEMIHRLLLENQEELEKYL